MKVIRIGHSPDADDAFMLYGIIHGKVDLDGFGFLEVVEDIESLNMRALRGELDVTAISAAAYPHVASSYRILSCGASIGRGYGPILVARQMLGLEDLKGKRVAVPGRFTTAYLLLQIYASGYEPMFLPYDSIPGAVISGEADAGLLIHEGQVTYERIGLIKAVDLGKLWGDDTGLPIVLGLDVVHRRLGEREAFLLFQIISESIRYAISHEDEALKYAQNFSRGLDLEVCRRFVRMYVNRDTVQMGLDGYRALGRIYQEAFERGLISSIPPLDILGLK